MRGGDPTRLVGGRLVAWFLVLYGSTFATQWWFPHEIDEAVVGNGLRLILIAGAAVVWGVARVRRSALSHMAYADWLATTPWTSARALPFGPVRLRRTDAGVVAGLGVLLTVGLLWPGSGEQIEQVGERPWAFAAGLTWISEWVAATVHPWLGAWVFLTVPLVILFLLPYVFVSAIALNDRPWERRVALALLPWMIFPQLELLRALGVLAVAAVVVDQGQRAALRGLPYRAMDIERSPRMRDAVTASVTVGKAFGGVAPVPMVVTEPSGKTRLAGGDSVVESPGAMVVNRAIVAWWLTVIGDKIWREDGGAPWMGKTLAEGTWGDQPETAVLVCWSIVAGGLLIARMTRYRGGYGPPISLWGRVRTGRLIWPRFDQVYVTPVLVVGWWLVGPRVLAGMGLAGADGWRVFLVWVSLWGLMMLARMGPPTVTRWQHTGQHRVITGASPTAEGDEEGDL